MLKDESLRNPETYHHTSTKHRKRSEKQVLYSVVDGSTGKLLSGLKEITQSYHIHTTPAQALCRQIFSHSVDARTVSFL